MAGNKMKSHKGSKGRVRITANGKMVRRKGGVRHFMTHRTPKKKRQNKNVTVDETKGYLKMFKQALYNS